MQSLVTGALDQLSAPLFAHVQVEITKYTVCRSLCCPVEAVAAHRQAHEASHYKWPLAVHMDFGPDAFRACHPRVHQRISLEGAPGVTKDAPSTSGTVCTVSHSVTWRGDLI